MFATTQWAVVYFYAWYFVSVIVLSNVVTAFFLDSFQLQRTRAAAGSAAEPWHTRLAAVCKSNFPNLTTNMEFKRPFHSIFAYEELFKDDVEAHKAAAKQRLMRRRTYAPASRAVVNPLFPSAHVPGAAAVRGAGVAAAPSI